jgi:hypothetical protein
VKRTYITLIAGLALNCAVARADIVSITLDSPILTGSPGDVFQVFGQISNITNNPVFLNSDTFNLNGIPQSALNDLFLSNVPVSLGPFGQGADSSGDIELFDITIPSPFAGGTYSGSYSLVGGVDGNAQDSLDSVSFTVDVLEPLQAPEPASVWLMLACAALAMVVRKPRAAARRLRQYR